MMMSQQLKMMRSIMEISGNKQTSKKLPLLYKKRYWTMGKHWTNPRQVIDTAI